MSLRAWMWRIAAVLAVALPGASAVAEAGKPVPWQIGFQPAASPVMEGVHGFNNLVFIIAAAILVFVIALLAFVALRFRARRNPEPSRTSHNTVIEVLWTVIPIMILVVIAIPSFKLLYFMDRHPNAEMTVKAIGHQWYWTYEYPDQDIRFDAFMKDEGDLEKGEPRLLATDNAVVLPVDTPVRVLTTATDVIHAWAVPAFGIKLDSIPGQVNETWVKIDEKGTYYGQCSELCGQGHGYMPIMVKAVSKEAFQDWVKEAQTKFASDGAPTGEAVASRTAPDAAS